MARMSKASEQAATQETLVLTPEEIAAVLAVRDRVSDPLPTHPDIGINQLAEALTRALEATKPKEKKTVANRVRNTPWTPKDGSPKILELRRKVFQHGIEVNPKKTHNETCLLLNKLRPGIYLGGQVRVTKRRDGGLNIEYPFRTGAQKLKMVSMLSSITYPGSPSKFHDLIQRLVEERADPKKYAQPNPDDDDDF